MSKVNSTFLLEMFRSEYQKRLSEVIGEADAFDGDGNMILSPDLKVRHKKSGLEYTIDRVEGGEGDLQVFLRSPEDPRFEPAPETKEILGEPKEEVLGEQEDQLQNLMTKDTIISPTEEEDIEEEVIFVVDQSEFESNYEVD
jgi:hypothetical protein